MNAKTNPDHDVARRAESLARTGGYIENLAVSVKDELAANDAPEISVGE